MDSMVILYYTYSENYVVFHKETRISAFTKIYPEMRVAMFLLSIGDFELTGVMEQFSIILPVVLYGCETWSLTLREESRLRVFENRILRRIFGPKNGE